MEGSVQPEAAGSPPPRRRRWWEAEFLSAKDLAIRAIFLAAVFLVLHAAGLREYTSFLSGTPASGALSWRWSAFLGTAYLLSWFGFILLAPICFIAAGLVALFERRRRGSSD